MKKITQSVDFERVLRSPSCAQSVHFAVHFLSTEPKRKGYCGLGELALAANGDVWLGMVVPKRHAKRSVTRNLLKRQIRQTFQSWDHSISNGFSIPKGMWVVRLRSVFDQKKYLSAASNKLHKTTAQELSFLLEKAVCRLYTHST